MSKNMLPFRFRLLDYLGSVEEVTPKQTMVALEGEYGKMKYFTLSEVEEHYLSMVANGIADETYLELDDDGNLEATYSITDYGRSLLENYLPNWYSRT